MFSVRSFDCFPLSKGDDTFDLGSQDRWYGMIPYGLVGFVEEFLVDVRTYFLGGAIDSSKANGIIRDPKLELESLRFTFDLVPLSYESVDVVVGQNRLLRYKAEMELVGFTPRRRIGFRMELVQGATLICEGSCRLTSLERQEVWNDCRSCKVRVGSNGNLWWEASVLLGRKKGGVESHVEADRGLTDVKEMEDVREVFPQRRSRAKRKLSRCGKNQIACLEKARWVIAVRRRQLKGIGVSYGLGRDVEARMSVFRDRCTRSDLGTTISGKEMESGSYWLDKVRTSIWRDVRTLAIEEYEEGYSLVAVNMSPPIRRKYRASVAFATGCRRINKIRRGNRKIRVPIAMWPCKVEEKMTLKEVEGKTIQEFETKIIAKDGTITRVPGIFQGYETSEEESVERPRERDLYGFVDHPQLQQRSHRNEFAPHWLPQSSGNMNGWLVEDEDEVERNEVDSDLESTASSKPVWEKTTKDDRDCASYHCPWCSK
ncbi:hypothetical protein Tco_0926125 [Tanacetum coccineum]|uniref:Uncharacterized protein n=1 Tax=Tanacetum coccineum TaxID=301880 RepID=A0ABQ5D8V8_9ASTR